MHIPNTFGGGFRQHDFVCERNVEIMHQKYETASQSRAHSTLNKVEGYEAMKTKREPLNDLHFSEVKVEEKPKGFKWFG